MSSTDLIRLLNFRARILELRVEHARKSILNDPIIYPILYLAAGVVSLFVLLAIAIFTFIRTPPSTPIQNIQLVLSCIASSMVIIIAFITYRLFLNLTAAIDRKKLWKVCWMKLILRFKWWNM
jgi:hypothetical protein